MLLYHKPDKHDEIASCDFVPWDKLCGDSHRVYCAKKALLLIYFMIQKVSFRNLLACFISVRSILDKSHRVYQAEHCNQFNYDLIKLGTPIQSRFKA